MKWTKRASEIANGKYVEIEPKEVKALQLEGTSFDIHDAMRTGPRGARQTRAISPEEQGPRRTAFSSARGKRGRRRLHATPDVPRVYISHICEMVGIRLNFLCPHERP
jgi:hypothetical protein